MSLIRGEHRTDIETPFREVSFSNAEAAKVGATLGEIMQQLREVLGVSTSDTIPHYGVPTR